MGERLPRGSSRQSVHLPCPTARARSKHTPQARDLESRDHRETRSACPENGSFGAMAARVVPRRCRLQVALEDGAAV
ncbi:hypothetical protein CCMA1212_008926 [Trichoderma ghanense]|uniref:Uncharacterized protein n=1 Tax=Trichoderma ghanense TaxID=65468 RepID=A0ABY2GTV0_9HYPO